MIEIRRRASLRHLLRTPRIACLDAYEISEWWKRVLGYTDVPGDPNEPGAREVADRRRPDGSGWMVLEDPVGNRFCIVRSDAERAARSSDQRA